MTRAAISLALVLTMPAAFADGVTNLHNGTTGNVGIVNGGAGGGGQPSTPLHVVATNGVLQNLTFDQTTNARTQTVSRIPIVFACAATNVVFVFDNFYLQSGGTVDGAQAITIVKLALENTAPVATTPVTFGGQRNVTLAPGTVAQRSDAIAGPVVANQLYWIRVTATTPNVGLWQLGPFADPAFTGAAMYMYPPSQNIDQVDLTGALTQPGPSAIRPQAFGPSATLGICPGTGNRSVVSIGASWLVGLDDPFASTPPALPATATACAVNGTSIASGIGSIAHASLNVGGAVQFPFIKIAVSGTGTVDAKNWMDGSPTGRAQSYLQYGNILFDDMGANDINSLTAAQIETNNQAMWALARAAPYNIQQVVVMEMTQRTASTDKWSTLANQTPFVGFGLGTDAATVNAFYAANVGTAPGPLINGILTERFTRGSTSSANANYWLWEIDTVNGFAYSNTCAGLHPNATSYSVLGTELRGVINGLTVN